MSPRIPHPCLLSVGLHVPPCSVFSHGGRDLNSDHQAYTAETICSELSLQPPFISLTPAAVKSSGPRLGSKGEKTREQTLLSSLACSQACSRDSSHLLNPSNCRLSLCSPSCEEGSVGLEKSVNREKTESNLWSVGSRGSLPQARSAAVIFLVLVQAKALPWGFGKTCQCHSSVWRLWSSPRSLSL